MRDKFSFEEFLVEYYQESKELFSEIGSYTDWLNTVSTEELIEVANIYGKREYSRWVNWKVGVKEIAIEDIPELTYLKR